MICDENCPKGTQCKPIANIIPDEGDTFVCLGWHGEEKPEIYKKDVFRHCFKSETTESEYDYSFEDMASVVSCFADAMLLNGPRSEKVQEE
jgi:hypothetical protein